ncbi:Glutaredoxin [Dillenia turbinata]|uniref:Glutaredoxin n=1 Tax=Dillenia turbinata TaxID=194707 RepID=A0AAN8W3Z7_9MAGN
MALHTFLLYTILNRNTARDMATGTDATMNRVMQLASQNPLVIFSRSSCPICHSVKSLFGGFGASPVVYELDQEPNGRELERALLRLGRNPSVPAVFIGHRLVGGANEINSHLLRGSLVPMLMEAGAIFVWNRA